MHYEEYNPELYMKNEEILDYLAKLRGKVMFRYQIDTYQEDKDKKEQK